MAVLIQSKHKQLKLNLQITTRQTDFKREVMEGIMGRHIKASLRFIEGRQKETHHPSIHPNLISQSFFLSLSHSPRWATDFVSLNMRDPFFHDGMAGCTTMSSSPKSQIPFIQVYWSQVCSFYILFIHVSWEFLILMLAWLWAFGTRLWTVSKGNLPPVVEERAPLPLHACFEISHPRVQQCAQSSIKLESLIRRKKVTACCRVFFILAFKKYHSNTLFSYEISFKTSKTWLCQCYSWNSWSNPLSTSIIFCPHAIPVFY